MSEMMNISEIIIDERVRKDLGDIDQLASSIFEIGLLHPVVVYKEPNSLQHHLLAGQRRIEAFKKLGLKQIPVTVVTMTDVLKAELHENTVRKEFTFAEMCEIDDYMSPMIKAEAEKREKSGKPSANLAQGRTRDKMGTFLGMSHGTYDKFIKIKKAVKENPVYSDLPDKIDEGMSIAYAERMINTSERIDTPTPDLPEGEFELIYLDPPWKYDLQLEGAPNYKTMSLEEMKEEFKKLPAHKNCIMFMWATNPKLEEALELIKHWGFQYKTNIAWGKYNKKTDKTQITTGHYVRGAHELLLIATKGSPGTPKESDKIPSLILEPKDVKIHSRKPEIFYQIIEKLYPAKEKLEMFARVKRKGWTSWGDSVES